MAYRLLADCIVVLHGLFVLFVILGSLLGYWRRSVLWWHLPAAIWGAALELFGWVCPLTPLEQLFRQRAGQEGYSGGFVDHYLTSLIYPSGLTQHIQQTLGVLVIAVNVACYAALWRSGRLRRARAGG
jgi:uncharacterized protein DUF2784